MDPQPLRHLLATIGYRFDAAVEGAPETYLDFDAGQGIRAPRELVAHCVHVLRIARSSFEPDLEPSAPVGVSWAELGSLLHLELALLDGHLEQGTRPQSWTLLQMIQGPFADVLTHVGQLALLRRLQGDPVARQSYLRARVEARQTGPREEAGQ